MGGVMKIKTNRNFILILLSFFVLILCFQNCKLGEGSKSENSNQQSSSGIVLDGNGQPYDGKPFIVSELCDDGTIVSSRVVLNADGTGTLFRENCQTIQPITIDKSDINVANGQLIFSGKLFSLEKPALPLPGSAPWNYQLTGAFVERGAPLIVVDGYNESAASIAGHKANSKVVICSLSAGTRESWLDDADDFPSEVVGNTIDANEAYVDIRHPAVGAVMVNRIKNLKTLGCDGINFDNVDGYLNSTGFPLQAQDQMRFNQFLAFAAHDRGLIMALNNVPELSDQLAEFFEMVITEQCFQYNECDQFQAFTNRAKPVFAVEYSNFSQNLCEQAASLSLSLIFTNQELDGSQYNSCL